MSKKGKRLREFEKNNRVFNIEEARRQREENHRDYRTKKAAAAAQPGDGRGQMEPASEARKKKHKKKRVANAGRLAAAVVIAAFVLFTAFSAVRLIRLEAERQRLLEVQAQLLQMKEDLAEEAKLLDSPEYIERQARKDLRMIKDGELLFILSGEDGGAEETEGGENAQKAE